MVMKPPRRYWTQEELDYLKEHMDSTDKKILAKELGRSVHSIKAMIYKLGLFELEYPVKEYAIYKGDDLRAMGTAIECAKIMNVNPSYIKWLTTPTAKRRLATRKHPEKATVAELL